VGRADGSGRRVSPADVDDTGADILHVDMDAFFASVELLSHPEARGRPAIVGGRNGRSVVSSATYEARRFGVRSAMPVAKALRLCPDLIVLEPHMDAYRDHSARVMGIFREITPLVEPLSIDEAFLDVAGARKLFGSPMQIAALLRKRVHAETGLACSVGVASTKFVAKLASGQAKPDGLLVIPIAGTLEYLRALRVGALWGVGASTQEALQRLGLRTVGDLADTPVHVLQKTVGEVSGRRLHELAWGIDPRTVETRSVEKSIGREETFEYDVTEMATIRREILRLSDQTAARLRRGGLAARTVSLKVRFADFRTLTRSRTLPEATNVGRRLFEEAAAAFASLDTDGARIRLVGVRAEQLEPAGSESATLWDPDEEWRKAEHTVDQVAERFGRGAIGPASLVGTERATLDLTRTDPNRLDGDSAEGRPDSG
jgi:DNA polymerase-4